MLSRASISTPIGRVRIGNATSIRPLARPPAALPEDAAFGRAALAGAAAFCLSAALVAAPPAEAASSKIGEFAASGLLFKDSVQVSA